MDETFLKKSVVVDREVGVLLVKVRAGNGVEDGEVGGSAVFYGSHVSVGIGFPESSAVMGIWKILAMEPPVATYEDLFRIFSWQLVWSAASELPDELRTQGEVRRKIIAMSKYSEPLLAPIFIMYGREWLAEILTCGSTTGKRDDI